MTALDLRLYRAGAALKGIPTEIQELHIQQYDQAANPFKSQAALQAERVIQYVQKRYIEPVIGISSMCLFSSKITPQVQERQLLYGKRIDEILAQLEVHIKRGPVDALS